MEVWKPSDIYGSFIVTEMLLHPMKESTYFKVTYTYAVLYVNYQNKVNYVAYLFIYTFFSRISEKMHYNKMQAMQ